MNLMLTELEAAQKTIFHSFKQMAVYLFWYMAYDLNKSSGWALK
ncbi:hypothetical protein EZMO1_3607 [Endozoicomonas montiporae CL-33]|uniref:Uncharacterized protein n=1 Tax=Endozoicomonas montiporae CL-33 TaxID=570277 RepID=A0A142BFR0_9GAMM|nr:hypothetical protein EZMO1_3607 [Endozoicomonas montiporae CL-33]